ncbi:MAG: SDR family oxidoreductase, partial [Sphingomonadales bacterium]|nr:SDR family oxidoreductase [Sphingomonadales bacterium]
LRNMVKGAVPKMIAQGRGTIVNVGANAATSGIASMSTYCASKAVVMRLTESMAGELKDKGINVNAVLPTILDTPTNRADMPDANFSAWVKPEELANVMCFLSSDDASAIHGSLLPVTGRV